jgi:flagellar motor protein MotB
MSTKKKMNPIKHKNSFKEEQNKKQQELTTTLMNTYKAIRPTIIQAQRVLKVFESLEQKMQILRVISHDNLEKLDLSEEEYPLQLIQIVKSLQTKSKTFFTLKMEINHLLDDKTNYEELQDPDMEIENFELKEINKQLEVKEKEVKQLRKAFCKDVRNFIRVVLANKGLFEVN